MVHPVLNRILQITCYLQHTSNPITIHLGRWVVPDFAVALPAVTPHCMGRHPFPMPLWHKSLFHFDKSLRYPVLWDRASAESYDHRRTSFYGHCIRIVWPVDCFFGITWSSPSPAGMRTQDMSALQSIQPVRCNVMSAMRRAFIPYLTPYI